MAGGWKLIVEVCLPVPFVLLILMSLPAPRTFHRGVLTVVDKTLGLTFVGALSLLHIMLIVTGTCFLASIKTTSDLLAQRLTDADASPNVVAGHLGKRWRAGMIAQLCTSIFPPAERNFWISFICFTLWCLLARFFQIMKEKARIEDELRGYKPGTPAAVAATKPAAVPATKPDVSEPKKAK